MKNISLIQSSGITCPWLRSFTESFCTWSWSKGYVSSASKLNLIRTDECLFFFSLNYDFTNKRLVMFFGRSGATWTEINGCCHCSLRKCYCSLINFLENTVLLPKIIILTYFFFFFYFLSLWLADYVLENRSRSSCNSLSSVHFWICQLWGQMRPQWQCLSTSF